MYEDINPLLYHGRKLWSKLSRKYPQLKKLKKVKES